MRDGQRCSRRKNNKGVCGSREQRKHECGDNEHDGHNRRGVAAAAAGGGSPRHPQPLVLLLIQRERHATMEKHGKTRQLPRVVPDKVLQKITARMGGAVLQRVEHVQRVWGKAVKADVGHTGICLARAHALRRVANAVEGACAVEGAGGGGAVEGKIRLNARAKSSQPVARAVTGAIIWTVRCQTVELERPGRVARAVAVHIVALAVAVAVARTIGNLTGHEAHPAPSPHTLHIHVLQRRDGSGNRYIAAVVTEAQA